MQTDGDIADLRQFENFSYKNSRVDILAKKSEIETELMANNLIKLGAIFIDFVREFDLTKQFMIKSLLLCSAYTDLHDDKPTLDKNVYRRRKDELYIEMLDIVNAIISQNITVNE